MSVADQRHIGVLEGMLPEALRGKPRAEANAAAPDRPLFSKPTRFAISCMLVLAGFMFFFMARSAVTTTATLTPSITIQTDLNTAPLYFLLCLVAFFLGFRGLGKLIFSEPGRGASTDAAQSGRSQSNQAEGS